MKRWMMILAVAALAIFASSSESFAAGGKKGNAPRPRFQPNPYTYGWGFNPATGSWGFGWGNPRFFNLQPSKPLFRKR